MITVEGVEFDNSDLIALIIVMGSLSDYATDQILKAAESNRNKNAMATAMAKSKFAVRKMMISQGLL